MGPALFAIPFACSLVVFCITERFVHAVLCILFRVSKWKQLSAQQVLVSQVNFFSSVVSSVLGIFLRILYGLLSWWFLFFVLFFFFSTVYVLYTEYPSVFIGVIDFYNADIGPYVSSVVIIPLQILDLLLRGLLPIWNAITWAVKALTTQGLLPILIEEIRIVQKMATVLIEFGRDFVDAFVSFLASFECSGYNCLRPEPRILNVLSCMSDVREFVALGVQLANKICGYLAVPLDILTFPLLDLNFAEGVHNIMNGLVQLFVVVPHVTYERCKAFGEPNREGTFSVMLCTPDFSPVFDFLVAGIGSLGLMLDNWVNVVFVIVQQTLTGKTVVCDTLETQTMIPDLLATSTVFGGRETTVVGLTDWLYAVTDGISAMYMGHSDLDSKFSVWPYPVDVGNGIAAVVYSQVHDLDVSALSEGKTVGSMQTTAMMGCSCVDSLSGIEVWCSIVPMGGVPDTSYKSDYQFQVLFPDDTVSSLMVCDGIDIYVKSVRWPFTRYETASVGLGTSTAETTIPSRDCISRGTCREVDSTVWLFPRYVLCFKSCSFVYGLTCIFL